MDADIVKLYHQLKDHFPLYLHYSIGVPSGAEYPVLCGSSVLGKFELYYDDLSFAFYAMNDKNVVFAHLHLESYSDAECTVREFMEGNLTIVQWGYPHRPL